MIELKISEDCKQSIDKRSNEEYYDIIGGDT